MNARACSHSLQDDHVGCSRGDLAGFLRAYRLLMRAVSEARVRGLQPGRHRAPEAALRVVR